MSSNCQHMVGASESLRKDPTQRVLRAKRWEPCWRKNRKPACARLHFMLDFSSVPRRQRTRSWLSCSSKKKLDAVSAHMVQRPRAILYLILLAFVGTFCLTWQIEVRQSRVSISQVVGSRL